MITAHQVLEVLYFFLPAYIANMSPVLVRGHLKWLATPIDAGRTWRGKRILGDHKTWRGILSGVIAGVLVYEIQRLLDGAGWLQSIALLDYGTHPVLPGLLLGLGTGVGDAVKSFFKRQVGIVSGESWLVFDQVDFFIGAYVFVTPIVVPPLAATIACLPIVVAGSVAVTAVGYGLGLKEAWI